MPGGVILLPEVGVMRGGPWQGGQCRMQATPPCPISYPPPRPKGAFQQEGMRRNETKRDESRRVIHDEQKG